MPDQLDQGIGGNETGYITVEFIGEPGDTDGAVGTSGTTYFYHNPHNGDPATEVGSGTWNVENNGGADMLVYAIPVNVMAMIDQGIESETGLFSVFGDLLISGSVS